MISQYGVGIIAEEAIRFTIIGKYFPIETGNATESAEPEIIIMILGYGEYLRLDQPLLYIVILKMEFLCRQKSRN